MPMGTWGGRGGRGEDTRAIIPNVKGGGSTMLNLQLVHILFLPDPISQYIDGKSVLHSIHSLYNLYYSFHPSQMLMGEGVVHSVCIWYNIYSITGPQNSHSQHAGTRNNNSMSQIHCVPKPPMVSLRSIPKVKFLPI